MSMVLCKNVSEDDVNGVVYDEYLLMFVSVSCIS